jgi:hypothetical protein
MYVLSYVGLRKAVGIIALAAHCSVGWKASPRRGRDGRVHQRLLLHGDAELLQLCPVAGVFLFSYRYAPPDNFLSNLASLFA